MAAVEPTTFHAHVSLPESAPVVAWLTRHELVLLGELGMCDVTGPGPTPRVTVDARSERAARARLEAALRAVGGELLDGPLRPEATPAIDELNRLTDDLHLDAMNAVGQLTIARSRDLAEQHERVARAIARLRALGYGAHPAVARAQSALASAEALLARSAAG